MGRPKRKNTHHYRRELENKCGIKCMACGTTENIEYHHIVPLWMGGKDEVSNMMALCHSCHTKIHNKQPTCIKNQGGRHSIASKNKESETVFNMYINGEIGNKKAKELLGYSQRTELCQIKEFNEFISKNGIAHIRNDIDIRGTVSKDGVHDGDAVGKVYWANGEETPLIFKDTGANDIQYVKRNLRASA